MASRVYKQGRVSVLLVISLLLISIVTYSQNFGRNKVNYRDIRFKVLQSPHFELYHYIDNPATRDRITQQMEQWYQMHQVILRDTFKEKNPVILYNNHADFQQTNTIGGLIGTGTGGVTEALKNRVIMPFMESNAQTDHVLGHELVHAFQYYLVKESDSLSLRSLDNLPLWLVEGLAEYMSIGYKDAHTAIWMRSAVANNKLPTLKLMTNRPYEYFPYRWGQAFWAYVTGIWGDKVIRPLYMQAAKTGYEDAIKRVLGIDEKKFSTQWQQALTAAYGGYRQTTTLQPPGASIVTKQNAGKMNVVPSISPDGRLLAFWSEKSVFNLDLYLAEATTGRIIEKLTTSAFTSHIDEFSSFESTVAWSPDSRRLAFVVFAKGRNRLVIVNNEGKIREELDIPGVLGFSNPTWSPDGKTIVVTGLVDGQSDLYAFDLETKTVNALTQDRYADLQPSFSPDGEWIVFATDRRSMGGNTIQHQYGHDIALLKMSDRSVRVLDLFAGANNLNPVFGQSSDQLYFLSDRDGFRNLYSYSIAAHELSQLTDLYTGITGITLYAPAISSSRATDQVVYTYYNNEEYALISIPGTTLTRKIITQPTVNDAAAMLPPFTRSGTDIVQNNLQENSLAVADPSVFVHKPYKPKFQLDYIGNSGVGTSTGNTSGMGLAGGAYGIFSDMLGHHQLYGSIALNGELYDFGGQFVYMNASNRLNWGAAISHIPYISGVQRLFLDTLVVNQQDTVQVANSSTDLLRTFEDQGSLFAAYPFSQTRRLEAGTSFARYYYRVDRYSDYYTVDLQRFIGSERRRLPAPKGGNFGSGYIAYVGDNSQFGVASPLAGHRFRFEASKYMGLVNLHAFAADYRRYFRMAPFTLATRNIFNGRYGKDAESGVLPPLYIGYPFLIRGYEATGFAQNTSDENITINDLIGSKMFITNAELRFPLSGPERLSAIRSRFFLTELALFTDGGMAWGNPLSPTSQTDKGILPRDSKFILSSGLSLRVNLLGYVVIEPYYAVPWQNGGFRNATFGLNFMPGW